MITVKIFLEVFTRCSEIRWYVNKRFKTIDQTLYLPPSDWLWHNQAPFVYKLWESVSASQQPPDWQGCLGLDLTVNATINV